MFYITKQTMSTDNKDALTKWLEWRRESDTEEHVNESIALLRTKFTDEQLCILLEFFGSSGCADTAIWGELGDYLGAIARFLQKK